MNNQSPVVFNFVSNTLRIVMIDGEPWFVAADVCASIGITTDQTRRLDDDEKGLYSIQTPSGDQEMTIINESGLYSMILGSRKPEAKKFKKWVTAEVLPAIRKTGRYVAPTATPDAAHETLNSKDMGNLTRLVWVVCNSLWGTSAWTQAVWFRLRAVTGTQAPNRFHVRHLPILASEIRRICALTNAFKAAQCEASKLIIKRVLRGGEDEGPVLAEMNRLFSNAVAEDEAEMEKRLWKWHDSEIAALTERCDGFHGHTSAFSEPKGEKA